MSIEKRIETLERKAGVDDDDVEWIFIIRRGGENVSEERLEALKAKARAERPGQGFYIIIVPDDLEGGDEDGTNSGVS